MTHDGPDHAELISVLAAFLRPPRNGPIPVNPVPESTSILTCRCVLRGSEPEIWRRVELRGDLTLDQAHLHIQELMGWSDSHLHRFLEPGGDRWGGRHFLTDFDEEEGETGTREDSVRLDQVLGKAGDELLYDYDFGDGWEHALTVEALRPAEPGAPASTCLAGERACPPEDVGGIVMWNGLAARLRLDPDPEHLRGDEEFDMFADWLPSDVDPDRFDGDETNRALGSIGAELGGLLGATAEGAVPMPGTALRDVLQRSPARLRRELLRLWRDTWSDPAPVSLDELARLLAPWQTLLAAAKGEGIKLTKAGWMDPKVCEDVWSVSGWQLPGYRGNREQNTPEVRRLRELAVSLGLLRKLKGHLVLTPSGRAAMEGPDALSRSIAARLLAAKQAEVLDERVLALLQLASDRPQPGSFDLWSRHRDVSGRVVTRELSELGWEHDDGTPLEVGEVRELSTVLFAFGADRPRRGQDPATERVVQHLAREALASD